MSLSSRFMGSSLTEADFRLIAESIPHIVWMSAPDGSTRYLNRRGTEYAGLPEANHGLEWLSLVHPDDMEGARRAWEQSFASETSGYLECRLRRADGAYRWHACRGQAVRAGDGTVVKWISTATDIEGAMRAST